MPLMPNDLAKVVILARGLGTRMRRADPTALLDREQAAIADTGGKAMIPIDRPFLDYVLSGLADVGFREFCLVVGPEHTLIRRHYDSQPLRRVNLTYAIQPEPRGTADAVLAAQGFTGYDEFLVVNSDNYYPTEALRRLRKFDEPGTILFDQEALVRNSNIPPERIAKYAYAEVSGMYLSALQEKPASGVPIKKDAPISMNLWRFSPAIFEHCRLIEKSSRGEYELPNAVVRAVQNGMRLRVEVSNGGVLDLSERADVPAVGARLRGTKVSL